MNDGLGSVGLALFTLLHVAISLVGIEAGIVVLYGWCQGLHYPRWTSVFLWTTVATSVTGFGFPVDHFMPSHAIAILSLVILAVAIYALKVKKLAGWWRPIYVVNATAALYLNVFVLIIQTFLKVPALHDLAPTQSEPPFAVTQLVVLLAFVVLGVVATLRFRGEAIATN